MSNLSKTGKPLNEWQLFVKNNMAAYKQRYPQLQHKEIMGVMSPDYRAQKGLPPRPAAYLPKKRGQCTRLPQAKCEKQDVCKWSIPKSNPSKAHCISKRIGLHSRAMQGPFVDM